MLFCEALKPIDLLKPYAYYHSISLNLLNGGTFIKLMKTTERLSANHFHVTLDISAPDYMNAVHFTSHEVQMALGHFLMTNPDIIARVFETLGKTSTPIKDVGKLQNLPLPQISSKMQQALDSLENHKPSRVSVNSTQLLRKIRDNG
ncbi:MAG: hypothetical protein DRR16_14960 [Candidatus Parabeggiatoa sp. nov. 3]|jgi:hypothetical protein|nr:MAG: hypothetical protein DRR00_12480 [Gammaproteobacteria bacterium]RKZ84349.1 MAG: hypothetical protein DRR16_14960 [Gammaproteobacteria bacterium]